MQNSHKLESWLRRVDVFGELGLPAAPSGRNMSKGLAVGYCMAVQRLEA